MPLEPDQNPLRLVHHRPTAEALEAAVPAKDCVVASMVANFVTAHGLPWEQALDFSHAAWERMQATLHAPRPAAAGHMEILPPGADLREEDAQEDDDGPGELALEAW